MAAELKCGLCFSPLPAQPAGVVAFEGWARVQTLPVLQLYVKGYPSALCSACFTVRNPKP